MAKRADCGEDMTVFEIVERCGKIVFASEDAGWIYTWNGGSEFGCWQQADGASFYQIDFWTTDVPPKSLDEAVQRCRARLSDAMADEAVNEVHDARVDRQRAP